MKEKFGKEFEAKKERLKWWTRESKTVRNQTDWDDRDTQF